MYNLFIFNALNIIFYLFNLPLCDNLCRKIIYINIYFSFVILYL